MRRAFWSTLAAKIVWFFHHLGLSRTPSANFACGPVIKAIFPSLSTFSVWLFRAHMTKLNSEREWLKLHCRSYSILGSWYMIVRGSSHRMCWYTLLTNNINGFMSVAGWVTLSSSQERSAYHWRWQRTETPGGAAQWKWNGRQPSPSLRELWSLISHWMNRLTLLVHFCGPRLF